MNKVFPCLVLAKKRARRWVPWSEAQDVSFAEQQFLMGCEVLDWRPEFVIANGKMRKAAP